MSPHKNKNNLDISLFKLEKGNVFWRKLPLKKVKSKNRDQNIIFGNKDVFIFNFKKMVILLNLF